MARQTRYNVLLAQTKESLNHTKEALELIKAQELIIDKQTKHIQDIQATNKELLIHLELLELKIIPTISH